MGYLHLEDLATSRLPPSKRHAVVRLGQWAQSYTVQNAHGNIGRSGEISNEQL
jgi:hypothetical protein